MTTHNFGLGDSPKNSGTKCARYFSEKIGQTISFFFRKHKIATRKVTISGNAYQKNINSKTNHGRIQ